MVIKTFLYNLLYTFTSIDRYLAFHPFDAKRYESAHEIGLSHFSFMIWAFAFSFIILLLWMPNVLWFHISWTYIKIGVAILASILVIPYTNIFVSKAYTKFVEENYHDYANPPVKWHFIAHGLHLISITLFLAIIVFL